MNINKENLLSSSEVVNFIDHSMKLIEHVVDYMQLQGVPEMKSDVAASKDCITETGEQLRSILTRANREAIVCEGAEDANIPEVVWAVLEYLHAFSDETMTNIGSWLYESGEE